MHYIDDTPDLGAFVLPYPKNPPTNNIRENAGRGKLIVVEGLDGAGKTTQSRMLCERLGNSGKKVHYCNFIHSDFIKPSLLKMKWENCDPYTSSLVYAMGLSHVMNMEIIPRLNDDYTVVLDRYVISIMVKGLARGLNKSWLEQITSHLRRPSHGLFIDTPLETCLARKLATTSGRLSYWECGGDVHGTDTARHSYDQTEYERMFLAYQARVREEALSLARDTSTVVIDGGMGMGQIHDAVFQAIFSPQALT